MKGVAFKFPPEIAAQCWEAWSTALIICEQNGIKPKPWKGAVVVRTRPGEKKFRNGWAWMHNHWKTWVMAHCAGGPKDFSVMMATDPKDTRKGWRLDSLVHEFCHVILIAGYGIRTHDSRLWGKVFGWHKDAVGG
jgi:hypothetical protein